MSNAVERKWRADGRCGWNFKLSDGTAGQCDPDGESPCCSNDYDGECGNSTEHCLCDGCADFSLLKEERKVAQVNKQFGRIKITIENINSLATRETKDSKAHSSTTVSPTINITTPAAATTTLTPTTPAPKTSTPTRRTPTRSTAMTTSTNLSYYTTKPTTTDSKTCS